MRPESNLLNAKPRKDDLAVQKSRCPELEDKDFLVVIFEQHPLIISSDEDDMENFSTIADHARDMLALDPPPVVDSCYYWAPTRKLPRHSEDFFYRALHGAYDPFQLFGMSSELNKNVER
jgi:hypothetical protein